MHQLEREQWLSRVIQKHKSSIRYSFIIIHSVVSENVKKVNLIIREMRYGGHSFFRRGDFTVSDLKF